ncbi:MAG: hypothetical protein ACM3MK_11820 [Chitinophagales bacterium]
MSQSPKNEIDRLIEKTFDSWAGEGSLSWDRSNYLASMVREAARAESVNRVRLAAKSLAAAATILGVLWFGAPVAGGMQTEEAGITGQISACCLVSFN